MAQLVCRKHFIAQQQDDRLFVLDVFTIFLRVMRRMVYTNGISRLAYFVIIFKLS